MMLRGENIILNSLSLFLMFEPWTLKVLREIRNLSRKYIGNHN